MTAINVIRKRGSVSIIVDGAGYDAEGTYLRPVLKCVPLPHLRAAVAARGSMGATPWFASIMAGFPSFDWAVKRAAPALEEMYPDIVASIAGIREEECNIFLAGWSEKKDAPESYVLTSCYDPEQDLEPWTWHAIDALTIAPMLTSAQASAAGLLRLVDAEDFDIDSDGVKLLNAQRALRLHATSDKTGDEVCTVGAFATVTTITSSGVRQRLIHRWDEDRVGQRLLGRSPSRHERRAAAAIARRSH